MGLFTSVSFGQVDITVETDKSEYLLNEPVEIYITAHNLTNDSLTLQFPTSCQSEYYIDDFYSASYHGCYLALTQVTIAPNGVKTWNWTHSLDRFLLVGGIHTVVGEVLGYGLSDTVNISILSRAFSYFPLVTGSRWTLVSQSEAVTETVVEDQLIDGLWYFFFDQFRDLTGIGFRMTTDKIYKYSDWSGTSEVLWYDFSAKVGDSWEDSVTYDVPTTITLISESDSVVTPAGTYDDCYHFQHFIGDDYVFNEWFTPGIGLVQRDVITIAGTTRWQLLDSILNIVTDPPASIPESFVLYPNFPNPFNLSTTIRFSIPTRSKVTITVYNLLGKEVAILLNRQVEKGIHNIYWKADNIPSGLYFITMSSSEFRQIRKALLLK